MSHLVTLLATSLLILGPARAVEPERRVLLDDQRWLAVENTYPPGSESPLHTHRWPRTVYVLEGGTIELVGADGVARRIVAAPGQLMARPPETHLVRNPGTTTIRVLETAAKTQTGLPTYAFTGARWFDGERFVERTLYSADGLFTDRAPPVVDEIVDLTGSFVVPPFGDAHNHHFDNPPIFEQINSTYLNEGIFYALSMNNTISGKEALAAIVRRPDTIDVAYADLGVTATLGHPIMIYETLARGSYEFDRTTVAWAREPKALGDAYLIVDDADELAAEWDRIVASRPALVKIYLLFSEDYETRRDRTETYGDRGLNPALVPAIVARAQAIGVRLAAHVETAHDFRVAVSAGVGVIAHLPGYYPDPEVPLERHRLTEADAQLAAERGVVVVPTPLATDSARYRDQEPEYYARVQALQRANVELLKAAEVPMAIGADAYFAPSSKHAFELHDLNLFSPRELLQMWSVTTPQLAFPGRAIARLEPGYEASFIALAANPLEDFHAVKEIMYRFKQGRPIAPAASSEASE